MMATEPLLDSPFWDDDLLAAPDMAMEVLCELSTTARPLEEIRRQLHVATVAMIVEAIKELKGRGIQIETSERRYADGRGRATKMARIAHDNWKAAESLALEYWARTRGD